jgi:hypothetical protein
MDQGADVVEVREIDARQRIADERYLAIVFENHAMIVDAKKGSTRIIPLDDKGLTGVERTMALITSAKQTAALMDVPVVYLLRYPWTPNDPHIVLPP